MLRPDEGLRHFTLGRPAAHADLGRWVERYWTVRWDLPSGTSYLSSVLSHPAVHLSVESGAGPRHGHAMPGTLVHGVVTRRFDILLRGEGRVFGVKFRPGGFAAFTGANVAAYTDRAVPLADVLTTWAVPADAADADDAVNHDAVNHDAVNHDDADEDEARERPGEDAGGPAGRPAALAKDAHDLQAAILAATEDEERVALMDEFLLARRPPADPRYEQVLAIAADMLADRALTAVQAVAERHDIELRTLQRLFRRYVGVGPKWVLRRFRLHDAQAALDAAATAGDPAGINLAELAASLGWFDQAHFNRDFREIVGVPPGVYATSTTTRR
ncbi:AraC family transcriptional regulator [Pseudofrankia asymbiotica]|uniref:AraC family transcriptional regulator n=1 Tax=Pseudofrankia asymbiotica TaxID=1834516 RepID=UPI001F527D83|nr:helix-turn-helix domain-containing protein [Pseudofrankia asymbiotica]